MPILSNLKRTVVHLLVIVVLAIINVNCSRKQTATATVTDTSAAALIADLQKYAGRYDIQSDEISWAEVSVDNNKLYGESDGRPKTELISEGKDKFKVQGMDATVTFTRDSQQQVNGLVIYYQGYEVKGQKVK